MTVPLPVPRIVRMHAADNVAIVANDGGLPAGSVLEGGVVLRDKVPQGHKVALVDLPAGTAVRRYDVPIGFALQDIPAGLQRADGFVLLADRFSQLLLPLGG